MTRLSDDQIKQILDELGYKFHDDGAEGYFLPIRRAIKFQTPIKFSKIRQLFEVEESAPKKTKKSNGLKKTE